MSFSHGFPSNLKCKQVKESLSSEGECKESHHENIIESEGEASMSNVLKNESNADKSAWTWECETKRLFVWPNSSSSSLSSLSSSSAAAAASSASSGQCFPSLFSESLTDSVTLSQSIFGVQSVSVPLSVSVPVFTFSCAATTTTTAAAAATLADNRRILLRVMDSSDLASHLFQWLSTTDIGRFATSCCTLSFLPFRCRFSVDHSIRGWSFCKTLREYEAGYDQLVSKIAVSSSPLFECTRQTTSQRTKKIASEVDYLSTVQSSSCTSTISMPSTAFQSTPHKQFSLRSLRLASLHGNVRFAGTIDSDLTFLRSHLLHYHSSIRTMTVSGERLDEHNKQRGSDHTNRFISPSDLPRSLTQLTLRRVDGVVNQDFPPGLQILDVGDTFCGELSPPPTLRKLILGGHFTHTFTRGQFPSTLEELEGYHQCPMSGDGVLPLSLKVLKFSILFKSRLLPGSLPVELDTLALSSQYRHALPAGVLPPMLRCLTLAHCNTATTLSDIVFPPSLHVLKMWYNFNQPILSGQLNEGLTILDLNRDFDHPLPVGALPSSLVSLQLSSRYSHPLLPHALPPSLRHLVIYSDSFPLSCLRVSGVIPPSLEWLALTSQAEDAGRYSLFSCVAKYPSLLPPHLPELRVLIKRDSLVNEFEKKIRSIQRHWPTLSIRFFESLNVMQPPVPKLM